MAAIATSYARWSGDLETSQAAAVVKAHWLNGLQDECLDAAGVPAEGWLGWEIAIGEPDYRPWFEGTELVLPPVRFVSYEAWAGAPSGRLDALQRRVPPERYRAAIDACSSAGDVGSDADLATYVNPPQIEALRKQWVRALAAGVKGAPAEQVLACVEAADPPAPFKGDPGRGGEKWWAELDAMTPVPEEIPIGGESASPAWNDFLLAEEALVGLLWHCQGDGDVLLAHVRDVAERFEVDHEAEIAAAAQAWQRTRARATELGWSPERPLAALDGERLE